MIINTDQKQMQMEQRDINYILPAYIRQYLFQSKNIDPDEIVFPMFSSVPHPVKRGVTVPIRWVPEISPEAMEIAIDGTVVSEATEEEIVAKDEEDEMRMEAKAEIETLSIEPPEADSPPASAPEELSPARAAFAEIAGESIHKVEKERYEEKDAQIQQMESTIKDAEVPPTAREIKGPPSGPILPPGTPLDNMAPRDRGDQMLVAKSLVPEPDVEEDKEVEVEIKKPEEEQQ